jgi:hemoglobin
MSRKILALLAASLLTAPVFAQPGKSLYERLGGASAIKVVVDDFVALTGSNPKVDFTRGGRYQMSDAKLLQLKGALVDFMAQAFGGPAKYQGGSMKAVHAGMKVTQAQFNAMAGDLQSVLEKHKVPKAELDEVMKIAASTAPDIVEVK